MHASLILFNIVILFNLKNYELFCDFFFFLNLPKLKSWLRPCPWKFKFYLIRKQCTARGYSQYVEHRGTDDGADS